MADLGTLAAEQYAQMIAAENYAAKKAPTD